MLFHVFMCLTVQQKYLLSRNICDKLCGIVIEKTTVENAADPVFRIVDNILRQVFGEKVTLLIYRHLESSYSLRTDEFSTKIDVFAKGLESFLSSGALLIERKILDDVYSSCGLLRKMEIVKASDGYDFASQVRFALQKT
jgi:hypothetical protein